MNWGKLITRRSALALLGVAPVLAAPPTAPSTGAPFRVQASATSLYTAGLRILDHAYVRLGIKAPFFWKVGLDARAAILGTGRLIAQWHVPPPDGSNHNAETELVFCGWRGIAQGRNFPLGRIELHSATHGHVGTVDVV